MTDVSEVLTSSNISIALMMEAVSASETSVSFYDIKHKAGWKWATHFSKV
jgi:hypothetical protein